MTYEYSGSEITQEDWNGAVALAERWSRGDVSPGDEGKCLLGKAFLHLKLCYDEQAIRDGDSPI